MKIRACCVLLALTAAVPAQCLFTSVATQSIGPGCNTGSTGFCKLVGLPTTLSVALDAANCTLDLQVNLFESCGVQVPVRVIAVGFASTALPLPEFGPGCMLHVAPIGFLTSSTGPFTLDLPPGVPSLSFLVQGAALSVAPLGGQGNDVLTFSDGVQVDLQ
ncbi:MAG: hypothetical protein JNM25_05075 [Planctomycetes bacterium]|nr:hypothetical protein [Planctomycetota bacterium]